ncbi:MAG: hypothetical protein HF312_02620 [Ignavibacteria bacterium]|jgi:hypothetical protein|nr:hypothetical protein [Ignavibacteria bacterium]MCU7519079.1 hypothetical protein [Ignavibacteria bacterium]
MSIHNFNLAWHPLGTLNNPITSDPLFNKFGVYLWIYIGNPNRIIYVGTACSGLGFRGRTAQHVGNAYFGLGSFFRLVETEDPYTYYKKLGSDFFALVHQRQLYSPAYPHTFGDWERKEINDFLSKVELWVCPVENNENFKTKEVAKYLETQIQYVLKKAFKLTYGECDKSNNSWLGKMEHLYKTDLIDYKFYFSNFPNLDTHEISLLKNLTDYIDKDPSTRGKIIRE